MSDCVHCCSGDGVVVQVDVRGRHHSKNTFLSWLYWALPEQSTALITTVITLTNQEHSSEHYNRMSYASHHRNNCLAPHDNDQDKNLQIAVASESRDPGWFYDCSHTLRPIWREYRKVYQEYGLPNTDKKHSIRGRFTGTHTNTDQRNNDNI